MSENPYRQDNPFISNESFREKNTRLEAENKELRAKLFIIVHDKYELLEEIERLKADRNVLESEVKAARILGKSSPIAFEFARSQWEDAKKETDRHFGSAYFL